MSASTAVRSRPLRVAGDYDPPLPILPEDGAWALREEKVRHDVEGDRLPRRRCDHELAHRVETAVLFLTVPDQQIKTTALMKDFPNDAALEAHLDDLVHIRYPNAETSGSVPLDSNLQTRARATWLNLQIDHAGARSSCASESRSQCAEDRAGQGRRTLTAICASTPAPSSCCETGWPREALMPGTLAIRSRMSARIPFAAPLRLRPQGDVHDRAIGPAKGSRTIAELPSPPQRSVPPALQSVLPRPSGTLDPVPPGWRRLEAGEKRGCPHE